MSTAEAFGPALQLGPLLGFDRGHFLVPEAGVSYDGTVDYPHAALADGTEGKLGAKGHSKLAYQEHIEGGSQRLGDLDGNRNSASRQAKNHYILTAQKLQPRRQLPSGVDTISELLHASSLDGRYGPTLWPEVLYATDEVPQKGLRIVPNLGLLAGKSVGATYRGNAPTPSAGAIPVVGPNQ